MWHEHPEHSSCCGQSVTKRCRCIWLKVCQGSFWRSWCVVGSCQTPPFYFCQWMKNVSGNHVQFTQWVARCKTGSKQGLIHFPVQLLLPVSACADKCGITSLPCSLQHLNFKHIYTVMYLADYFKALFKYTRSRPTNYIMLVLMRWKFLRTWLWENGVLTGCWLIFAQFRSWDQRTEVLVRLVLDLILFLLALGLVLNSLDNISALYAI